MGGKKEWARHFRPGIGWGLGEKLRFAPKTGAQLSGQGGGISEADATWHCMRTLDKVWGLESFVEDLNGASCSV